MIFFGCLFIYLFILPRLLRHGTAGPCIQIFVFRSAVTLYTLCDLDVCWHLSSYQNKESASFSFWGNTFTLGFIEQGMLAVYRRGLCSLTLYLLQIISYLYIYIYICALKKSLSRKSFSLWIHEGFFFCLRINIENILVLWKVCNVTWQKLLELNFPCISYFFQSNFSQEWCLICSLQTLINSKI